MTLRKDYDDARRELVWSINDVLRCSQRLEYDRIAGYGLSDSHVELLIARERRDKCESKVRALRRALVEAGEVVP